MGNRYQAALARRHQRVHGSPAGVSGSCGPTPRTTFSSGGARVSVAVAPTTAPRFRSAVQRLRSARRPLR